MHCSALPRLYELDGGGLFHELHLEKGLLTLLLYHVHLLEHRLLQLGLKLARLGVVFEALVVWCAYCSRASLPATCPLSSRHLQQFCCTCAHMSCARKGQGRPSRKGGRIVCSAYGHSPVFVGRDAPLLDSPWHSEPARHSSLYVEHTFVSGPSLDRTLPGHAAHPCTRSTTLVKSSVMRTALMQSVDGHHLMRWLLLT